MKKDTSSISSLKRDQKYNGDPKNKKIIKTYGTNTPSSRDFKQLDSKLAWSFCLVNEIGRAHV